MARRIKSAKRKRFMGSRSWGAGNIKKRRGKGNRGGVGRAGWGKHKWFWKIKTEGTQTEKGFFNPVRRAVKTVNLDQIARDIEAGKHPRDPAGVAQVDAKGFKVLGSGRFAFKARVQAAAFSQKAKEKIESAGGSAVAAQ